VAVPLHTHWPAEHVFPVPQVVPQPPQFALSFPLTLTHAVPQALVPTGQLSAQALPLQAAAPPPAVGAGQLVLQTLPQCLGSVLDTQAPPHGCWPELHVMPHVVPAVHVAVPPVAVGQARVHVPQ
jgi:hypothetical protein